MMEDVKEPRKDPWFKKVQTDHHGKCPGYQTARNCQESSLSCNILLSIPFHLIAFMKLRMFPLLFISEKLISSLKKLNSDKFEFDS